MTVRPSDKRLVWPDFVRSPFEDARITRYFRGHIYTFSSVVGKKAILYIYIYIYITH